MNLTEYQTILYQALNQPFGLVLRTNDPQRLRQRFYSARAQAQDPQLDGIQILLGRLDDPQLVVLVKASPTPGNASKYAAKE